MPSFLDYRLSDKNVKYIKIENRNCRLSDLQLRFLSYTLILNFYELPSGMTEISFRFMRI